MYGKIYVVSKIDAAVDQLDWSIRLFLDHKAYLPAITLAHAAEGIIGNRIYAQGGTSALHQLGDRISQIVESDPAMVRKYMNDPATWLKHWNKDEDPETLEMEIDTVATHYILRAAINLHDYDQTVTSEMPRFFLWIKENRPDIDPTREEYGIGNT